MNRYRKLVIVFICLQASVSAIGQEAVTISAENFNKYGQFSLSRIDGWLFSPQQESGWYNTDLDTRHWKKMTPFQLSYDQANEKGIMQGWFRFKFTADSSLLGKQLYVGLIPTGAASLYLNGKLIQETGHPDTDPARYKGPKVYFTEFETGSFPQPLKLEPGTYTIAIYFTEHSRYTLNRYSFRSMKPGVNVLLNSPQTQARHIRMLAEYNFFQGAWLIGILLLSMLFAVLLFLNREEKQLKWIARLTFALAISAIIEYFFSRYAAGIWQLDIQELVYYESVAIALSLVPITLSQIIRQQVSKGLKIFSGMLVSLYPVFWFLQGLPAIDTLAMVTMGTALLITVVICVIMIIGNRHRFGKPEWCIVWGLILFVAWMLFHTIFINAGFSSNAYRLATVAMIYLTLPITFLIYISIRFSENISALRKNLVKISALTDEKLKAQEEKQKLIAAQNEMLEKKVAERTHELEESMENLKATQRQLIQSEKMASLGELTAGIAHEIQNPLNFVNNFSEVSSELMDEMKEEISRGNYEDVNAIAGDVIQNLEKINHHGKRADAIVKGMLQHSTSSTGVKEPTDINALCDEYLRLSYHGLRAKDKSFNATLKTDFDNTIGKINIIPQDIGRVILNLVNNAFYAVDEKKTLRQAYLSGRQAQDDNNLPVEAGYEPTVRVSTKKVGDKIEITVADNGNGIPQKVLDKIFQPFFTTKPTGQGTGLGLSLSYDIIKAHGGELKVETKEARPDDPLGRGEGSTFIIQIPTN